MKRAALAMLLCVCTAPSQPANAPPDPPQFQRAERALTGVNVTWKNPAASDFEQTLVARYRNGPDGMPGIQVPVERAALGSGTVLYVGPAEAAFDPIGPPACGALTYQLFARDDAGQWSLPVQATISGTDPPPGPPTAFTATVAGTDVLLQWSTDAGTTRVVRAPDTVVYEGTATSATDAPPPGSSASYLAYACNVCGACTEQAAMTSVELTSVDLDAGHELRPSSLSAQLSADAGRVELAWSNPAATDAGFTHVVLVRRLDGSAHAETLYTGPATQTSEPRRSVVAAPHPHRYTVYGCSDAGCEPNGASTSFAPTLSQALKAGGYALWFRHATASTCMDAPDLGTCTPVDGGGWSCPPSEWWRSCDGDCATATARQLTPPQSDLETTTLHASLSAYAFDRVRTTEFCRGVRTATQLALGPVPEPVHELTFFLYDEPRRCANGYAMLAEQPAPGMNSVMVTHSGFSCPVLDSLASSECAVFKPTDAGALFITRVPYDGWP
jgi:hypothetical protein